MKPYIALHLLLPLFLIASCSPKEGPEPIVDNRTATADSVYFEHEGWGTSYYGMYRITDGTLQEDTTGKHTFDHHLSDSLHKSVVDIMNDIPREMINIEGRLFSNIAEHEPPTITVVAFCGDDTYSWSFMGIPDDLPNGTQAYMEKIKHLHQVLLSTR